MKGLVAQQSRDTIYVMVKYHCICAVSKKPREGFEAIKLPDISTGEEITKYIKRYDLEGIIQKIEWRDTKQQYSNRFMSWRIHIDANGTPVVLEIPWKSAPSDRFMKVAENIDFTKPVEFRAWKDTKGKTDKTGFAIFQEGQNVPQKYKQGEMGDCPEGTEEIDGWDFRAQLKYLHSQMLNVVIPKVDATEDARKDATARLDTPNHSDGPPDDWADDEGADF